MDFAEFLKRRRSQEGLSSAKEHFQKLGGEKALGISLRHFQQIESGTHPPSERLFAILFAKARADDRRALVIAFFESVLRQEQPGRQVLLEYLENHLTPGFETERKGIWETKKYMLYSAEQLDFLIANTDALQFHRKLLLIESCPRAECRLPEAKLQALEHLELITIEGETIEPSRNLYRLPRYDDSPSRLVSRATDFILKLQEMYVSREGSPNQNLSYAMQMVRPDAAVRILDQMDAFKKWVQSMAAHETGPEMSPFIFVGFAKKIERKEL